MSITLMSRVWETALPSTQKMVLLALADNANDQGRSCFPSIKTLSEKCTTSIRAVQTHIASLEEAGLIARKVRINVTSEYTLNVKLISELAAIEEARRQKEREETEWRIQNSRKNFFTKPVDNLAVACGADSAPHRENDDELGWNPQNEARGADSAPLVLNPAPLPADSAPLVLNSAPVLSNSAPITTIEPSINHHNNLGESNQPDAEPQRGCCDDSQNSQTDLIWPTCSLEEKTAITALLPALPAEQHQVLLDELEGARVSGSIRKGLVPLAGALLRAMLVGTFTLGHSPAIAARRRELANKREQSAVARSLPDISPADLARGQAVLSMISGKSNAHIQQQTGETT